MAKLNTDTINGIIKNIAGDNEDIIQQTWLEILEAKASQIEQIESIAQKVYKEHHRKENKIGGMLQFEKEISPHIDPGATYHDMIPDPNSVMQYGSELRAEDKDEMCRRKKLNKSAEKLGLPEEMVKDLNDDAIAHKFAQAKGYYPISRQHLSAEHIDIVYKSHCRGRPRNGEWKGCVMCSRTFYVKPSKKDCAYTCSRNCANKILGKFRWLSNVDDSDMFNGQREVYIANLIPFPKEQNPEAWQHYFGVAHRLLGRDYIAPAIRKLVARHNGKLSYAQPLIISGRCVS